jgi:hypothetical protein
MNDVRVELGVGSATIGINDTNVRKLAGITSGTIDMDSLKGKSWNINYMFFHGPGNCYSGQAGFSLDRINGNVILTMGAWPTDPPNCQTALSTWLQSGGIVNEQRRASNIRPFWTNLWTLNVESIAIGTNAITRAPNWPYTLVPWTYNVTRTGATSITIERYPVWGTGDTGTSISVNGWGQSFDAIAGVRTAGGWTITTVDFAEPAPPPDPGPPADGGGDGGGDGTGGDSGAGDSGDGDGGDGGDGGGDGGGE